MTMKKSILYAEDNRLLSELTSRRLIEGGLNVDIVNNGEEVLKKISDNHALLLLDLIMPKQDGFQVLTELKKMGNKIPVFVFSNLARRSDRDEVLKLGAKKYFVKDEIDFDDLITEIKKIIS